MRVEIPLPKAYHLINHGACPVITTGDGNRRDAAPINWTMPICDDPFLILMAVEDGIYTDELLRANGEFAVNVVGWPLAGTVLALGKNSGREMDKFKAFGLEMEACRTIQPPRLAGAKAHIECKVIDVEERCGMRLYTGQAQFAQADAEAWDGHRLLIEKVRTIHHVGGGLFAVTDRVEKTDPAPRR